MCSKCKLVHNVKPFVEHDDVITGHFCLDCDDWVVKEHNENIKHSGSKTRG